MKTKVYKRALDVVRSVINKWDPYSLLASGCPNDEFDAEIASLVTQIPRIHSPSDAIQAISRVFSAAFGPDGVTERDFAAVGTRLFAALCTHGLIDRE
jgi:hypothetical protein